MNSIKLYGTNDAEPVHAPKNAGVSARSDAQPNAVAAYAKQSADQIKVSDHAATVGKLVARIAGLPDVRKERIEGLRERIEAGTYHLPATEIADAILSSEG